MKKRDTFEKGLSDFSPLGENCVTKASRRLCSFSSFPPNSNCVYVERGGRKEMRFSFLIVAGEYVSYSRHETIKTEGKKLLRGNDDSQLVKDGFKSIPFL